MSRPKTGTYHRNTALHKLWSAAVLSQRGAKCECCGLTDKDAVIETHHVAPVILYPALAYMVENGSVLCAGCHKKVHSGRDDLIRQVSSALATDNDRVNWLHDHIGDPCPDYDDAEILSALRTYLHSMVASGFESYHAKYYREHKEYFKLKNAEYREAHREELAAYDKRYHEEHRDESKRKRKEYYEAHKEELKASYAEYRSRHEEQYRGYELAYRERNKDKIREQHREYRAAHRDEINARARERRRLKKLAKQAEQEEAKNV